MRKPDHVQFTSLEPLVENKDACPYDAIYGDFKGLQRAVTVGPFKMILYLEIHKVLLYNVASDPHEIHDLAGDARRRSTIRRLFARLLKLQKETGDELDLKAAYPDL